MDWRIGAYMAREYWAQKSLRGWKIHFGQQVRTIYLMLRR